MAFCLFLRHILIFGLMAVAGPDVVAADQPGQRVTTGADIPVDFDIPAQPLITALEAFSAASGYQILVADPGSEIGRSRAIKGAYFPRDALVQVVAGTGLEVRFTAATAAVLVRSEASRAALAAVPSRGDRQQFEARLQADVMRALCRNSATRPGDYRAALDLWVASSGRVDRADLLGSTGDSERDQKIVAALEALRSQVPPPGLAQPSTLLVMPRASESAGICDAFLPAPQRAGMR